MESILGSRLNSVGNARRKKTMNQNKTFSFFCLKNSLIQPISLSPAILGKVFFNVKLFNLLKGGEKVWEGEMMIDQIVRIQIIKLVRLQETTELIRKTQIIQNLKGKNEKTEMR